MDARAFFDWPRGPRAGPAARRPWPAAGPRCDDDGVDEGARRSHARHHHRTGLCAAGGLRDLAQRPVPAGPRPGIRRLGNTVARPLPQSAPELPVDDVHQRRGAAAAVRGGQRDGEGDGPRPCLGQPVSREPDPGSWQGALQLERRPSLPRAPRRVPHHRQVEGAHQSRQGRRLTPGRQRPRLVGNIATLP